MLWKVENKKTKVELVDASKIQFSEDACCGKISNYTSSSVSDYGECQVEIEILRANKLDVSQDVSYLLMLFGSFLNKHLDFALITYIIKPVV